MWDYDDIEKWLKFINLSNLAAIFKSTGIDGSCVHLLDNFILSE